MRQQVWQLQEAKNKFSQVVEQAIHEGPQVITRHGVEAVVVLSFEEYRRMLLGRQKLSEFFGQSPLAGAPIDWARNDDKWRGDVAL